MSPEDAASLLLERSEERIAKLRAAIRELRTAADVSAQSHRRLGALLTPTVTEEATR
ncbi:hypothetical protein ABT282_38480 [Streptomyces sp. NPDC000927]|uniref:hypothetical protein n=1 Tax=Streptomyces sp. NPDC000927 TaxID=3154371 RepID=UPI00332C5673